MKVKLLHNTPLEIGDLAIGKCWDKTSDKWKERMYRVANKFKHASTIEHINYTFDIDGISRACLQELARHRHQSLSVKSSRYTLGELKNEKPFLTDELTWDAIQSVCYIGKPMYTDSNVKRASKYLVFTGNQATDAASVAALDTLRKVLFGNKVLPERNASNDIAKYCMPEAYKTSLVSTMNMRALQNFLSLRTDKAALWEIQELAHNMFEVLPEEHKFMLEDFVKAN